MLIIKFISIIISIDQFYLIIIKLLINTIKGLY